MAAELYTEQDRCRQASLHCETVAALSEAAFHWEGKAR